MMIFETALYISLTLTVVSCHQNSNGKHDLRPFMSRQESSVFLYSKRNERSIDCAGEGVCEHNKVVCMKESDREAYCTTVTCPIGQSCTLTTPCPKHFQTGCIDINECASSPCKNGASCYNGDNHYTCACTPGWRGIHCDQDINECSSSPCYNGAICNNLHNSYTCSCVPGWMGSHCETDIDECTSNPCQNHATCINKINEYTCLCLRGWTGTNCHLDYNECQSNPCVNGATCHNGWDTYTCSCTSGWVGEHCHIDYDECQSNPCGNGATCNNGRDTFSCNCASGWTGKNCHLDFDECQSNPCVNGATCNNGRNAYTCSCVSGWMGTNCHLDYDECQSNPCVNGATCNNGRNVYTCSCASGWTGRNCHLDYDECQSNPCVNGATCNNERNSYTCRCASGWIGLNCNLDYNECQSNPCGNGASCINGRNAYTCLCIAGWIGINCETDYNECGSNPCQHESTCINGQNKYTCICAPGWTGVNCETDIDECSSSPCQNGGNCTNLLNQFTCTCSEDYTGLMCETDMCAPSSHNGADVVFVLDTSKSQTNSSFRKQKEYVKDFISNFPIGPTEFQFSVVSVSIHAKVHFYLNSFHNISLINVIIDSIAFSNSASYTHKAFQVIREDVFSNSKSLRAVPKYVVVLSDGLSSNTSETILQADLLKLSGVNFITVAIGKQIFHGELKDIASHSSKVFPASNTDAIYSIMKAHVMPACPDCFSNTSDVAILMDVSNDVSISSFNGQLDALRTLLKASPISANGVHVSFTRFADQVFEDFDFSRFATDQDVIVAVSSVSSKRQLTASANLSKALDHVLQNTFIQSKGRRSNARKVLLLLSSGIVSNPDVCKEKAQRLKDSGVTIVTVSIGLEINMTSLLEIASDPAFVYVLGDDVYTQYDVLYSLIGTLEYDVCEFD